MAKILWATKIGKPQWEEQLITEHEDKIEAASAWAKANGFDRLRIATVDLDTPPDFKAAVSKPKTKRGKK